MGWFEETTGGAVEVMGIELYMVQVSAPEIIVGGRRKSWCAVADTRTHTWHGMVNRAGLIGRGQQAAVL